MKELINFQYENQKVRTIVKNNEVWFVAKDVCDVLDISNPTDALKRLDDDERSILNLGRHDNTLDSSEGIITTPGNPNINIINEFGLYNLILGSRKAEAKAFKRWVTHEVLPAIRKDGVYVKEKPGLSLEYEGKKIMIESLMNERLAQMEMSREVIKQVRLLEKRVCELEDCSGLFAGRRGKPTVHIGSTNADDCTSLYVEFIFSKCKSFDGMNAFLQALETFLIVNGYHREKVLI